MSEACAAHDVRIEFVGRTHDSATLAFALDHTSQLKATLASQGKAAAAVETRDHEAAGRLVLNGLSSDVEFEATIEWDTGSVTRVLRTLPTPEGSEMWSFAVVADPHVAHQTRHRQGRLLVEAEAILRETIHELNQLQPDFVLMPGDLTNRGTTEEYGILQGLLGELACPYLAVAGDHDVKLPHGRDLFQERVGPINWAENRGDLLVVGCDTSTGRLGKRGEDWIKDHLPENHQLLVLVSHRQLIPDEYIVDHDKAVEDHPSVRSLIQDIPVPTLILVGHKNVPARADLGRAVQLNVPQLVQYPCGYLLVRCYRNGIYVTFQPMFAEVLNEFSRWTGSASGLARMDGAYRARGAMEHWNNVYFGGIHD